MQTKYYRGKDKAKTGRHPFHPRAIMRTMASYLLTIALVNGRSVAQVPAPQPTPHPLIHGWSLQSEGWSRVEDRQSSDLSEANPNHPQSDQTRLRLGLAWKRTPAPGAPAKAAQEGLEGVFVQPQFSFRRDTQGRADNGTNQTLAMHQAYGEARYHGLRWRLGRQEMTFGDARLVGAGNWTYMGRSFDELRVTKADKHGSLDVFAGRLGQAANKVSSPIFNGIYLTRTRSQTTSVDGYLLYKGDTAGGKSLKLWTLGSRPRFTFGQHYDATIEGAYQFGKNGPRNVSAWAYAANAGYTLPGRAGWRVALERDFASGGDPSGAATYRTFDQLYPTNHWLYGTIDYVGWRNMQDWRLSLKGKPASRWTVLVDGHAFALANARDFWYSDNGKSFMGATGKALRDPAGASSRALGTEVDVVLSYLTARNLTISGGLSRFQPGAFIRRVNGSHVDASNWMYIQTAYAF